ncbi:MAG: hypothetical protein OEL53_01085 [Rhodospirillales bacterium]|nr:hypothetical protein [Rhodospirillales bacterium]
MKEHFLPSGHEGVQTLIVNDMNLESLGVEPCRLQQWRSEDSNGIFHLGITDKTNGASLARRKGHQNQADKGKAKDDAQGSQSKSVG